MFTNVAQHQQTQHFPHPLQHADQINYNEYLSATNAVQNESHHVMRGGVYRHRLQKPQQYAYPLQKPLYFPGQEPSIGSYNAKPDISEHMLRRKTPNGTLAAGYDGRPVEWTTRPHATKHFLMPRSNTIEDTIYRSLPDDSMVDHLGASRARSFAARDKEQRQMWHANFTEQGDSENMASVVEPKPNMHPSAGLDSVLNQGSSLHQYGNLADGQRVPTALQPMWPPSLGLTSLNSEGPYGPYWPDGAFVPYRPAPLQDLRYPHQIRNANTPEKAPLQLAFQIREEWNPSCNETNYGRDLTQQAPVSTSENAFDDHYLELNGSQGKVIPLNRDSHTPQHHQMHLVHRGKRHPLRDLPVQSKPSCDYYPGPSTFGRPTASQNASHKSVSQVGHAHFKGKVLIWAHKVYISLLASVQQSRRNVSDGHHRTDRHFQSSIYPKPPRHSCLNSSRDYSFNIEDHGDLNVRTGALAEVEENLFHQNEQSITPDVTQTRQLDECNGSMQCSLNISTCHNNDSRQTWQPNGRQHSSLHSTLSSVAQSRSNSTQAIHNQHEVSPSSAAFTALEMLNRLCQESHWEWIDGMLLGGCLAYGLGDYTNAMKWYTAVLSCDPNNVEAMSNLAATLLSLNRREEAEQHWLRSIKLRPRYFEAIEHLVGLFCEDHRGRKAVEIIEYVETALRNTRGFHAFSSPEISAESAGEECLSPSISISEWSDYGISDWESVDCRSFPGKTPMYSSFGSSGYAIPPSDNGRMLALIHAKGNMLYTLGDNVGAAKAFEDAILIGAGKWRFGIRGLIKQILRVFSDRTSLDGTHCDESYANDDPILLLPDMALETSHLVFPPHGLLPGLQEAPNGQARKNAISIVSNSLLSLAKIYQDGMSSSGASANGPRATSGVQEILALYYLSLSLQPSPSTANNVGILLASVQQSGPSEPNRASSRSQPPQIPGVVPGSGVALALAYYNYGLNLDPRHAHLYTNLGSLFKDIGQLNAAIKMYEKAVDCDGNFDIALANLANAVKDQGRISDAITYYRRAVSSNPDFAEAVCGLANALNSVCSWSGRGGIHSGGGKRDRWHVDSEGMLYDPRTSRFTSSGWIVQVVAIVEKQLHDGESWGKGILRSIDADDLLKQFGSACSDPDLRDQNSHSIRKSLEGWEEKPWEGAKVVRLIERATKRLGWRWYWNKYIRRRPCSIFDCTRPQLPAALSVPSAPTVLPFHTFTCPLSAKQIRRISQRNGLRISCSTLRASWLPTRIYEPPAPPNPHLNVGYVSSDFNNHPLAHLMQSVFGFHNTKRVQAFCYATTASDGSVHRQQIEREAPRFYDTSSWSIDQLVNQIVEDRIHILVNLNGYTRGARNEVFAARPAPIQMSFMGFAGTLGAEWCDYLLADKIAVPPQTLRPWRRNVDLADQTMDENNEDDIGDWVYGENIIFTRDTFFCCDHRQSAPDSQEVQLNWADEQARRWRMRHEIFPELADDMIILGNFNQLYKIEPTTFRTWLRILSRVPKAVLWLLRFPDLGESNLKKTALLWVSSEVASRIIFTDVAPKHQHISRARICDLFLDTPECNAHTTAADVLWSGTPLLTLPRYEYKMCSRMAASILRGALPKTVQGDRAMEDLVVHNDEEYEERAVELGLGLEYSTQCGMEGNGRGRLVELRRLLYESRWESPLFDTRRWVRDLETAYEEAWRRWVAGEGGDIWL